MSFIPNRNIPFGFVWFLQLFSEYYMLLDEICTKRKQTPIIQLVNVIYTRIQEINIAFRQKVIHIDVCILFLATNKLTMHSMDKHRSHRSIFENSYERKTYRRKLFAANSFSGSFSNLIHDLKSNKFQLDRFTDFLNCP